MWTFLRLNCAATNKMCTFIFLVILYPCIKTWWIMEDIGWYMPYIVSMFFFKKPSISTISEIKL